MLHLEFVVLGPPVSYQTGDKMNLKAWQATIKIEAAKVWGNPPLVGKLKFLLMTTGRSATPRPSR